MTEPVIENGVLKDFRRAAVFFGSGTETEKAGRAFAGSHLNIIEKRDLGKFANGEVKLEIHENIRGRDITYFAPDTGNVFDDMMETLITLDCLRRHGALKIALLLPPSLIKFNDPLLVDSPFEPEMFGEFISMYEVNTIRDYKGKEEIAFNLLPPVSIVREPAAKTVVVHGHSSKLKAEKIAEGLGLPVVDWRDNDLSKEAPVNAIIIASSAGNPNQALLETAAMIYKLRRKGIAIANVVMELFHYARQERTDNRRVPLSTLVAGKILNYFRPNAVMTQDLHQAAIQNALPDTPLEPIYSTALIASKIADMIKEHHLDPSHILIGAVDRGAIGRVAQIQRHLKQNHGIDIRQDTPTVDKRHVENTPGKKTEVKSISHQDLVNGRILFFVDDMTDSGSTFEGAAEAAKKAGATHVFGFVTHVVSGVNPKTGMLNIAKLEQSPHLTALIGLDTVAGLTPAMHNLKQIDIMSNTQWLLDNIREWAWWLKSASEDASLKTLNDKAKPSPPRLRHEVESYLHSLFKAKPA